MSPTDEVTVRTGGAEDVRAAARALAAAFTDYPWIAHTVAADDRQERLFELYRTILDDLVVPYGRLWVAEGRVSPGPPRVVGAASWLTPESRPPDETVLAVEQRVRDLRGDRARHAADAEALVERHAPEHPAWYLGAIGVAPPGRGRGVGSELLRPALRLADQRGVPARLETSSRPNVAFYERHGFEVIAEVAIPDGPHCWVMERAGRVA